MEGGDEGQHPLNPSTSWLSQPSCIPSLNQTPSPPEQQVGVREPLFSLRLRFPGSWGRKVSPDHTHPHTPPHTHTPTRPHTHTPTRPHPHTPTPTHTHTQTRVLVTTGPLEKETGLTVVLANFHGINTPSTADFKLVMWCHWTWSWEDM